MEFNRIITLLRKERGVTQKQAAQDLGVSQALLSHYEKGIRECGLEFVVKVANYYGVSCDYLLGRSAEPTGQTLAVEDIPGEGVGDSHLKRGSALSIMSKKLITNSLNILFDKVGSCQNKALATCVSDYLMLAIYKMFRLVYSAQPKNASSMFGLTNGRWEGYTDSASSLALADVKALLAGEALDDKTPGLKDLSPLTMTTKSLEEEYPPYTLSCLLNLIHTCEGKINR